MTVSIMPLAHLAERINVLHSEATTAAQTAVDRAIQCGELLRQARAQCEHGTWADWLKRNFHGSARTARAYMALHKRIEGDPTIRQRVANLPLREAVAFSGLEDWQAREDRLYRAIRAAASEAVQWLETESATLAVIDTCDDLDALLRIASEAGCHQNAFAEVHLRIQRELGAMVRELPAAAHGGGE